MKILLILARGLQAGALGPYGNPWIDTATLNRLAAEGIVFDQHFASRADAAGACQVWRSGRYAFPGTPTAPAPADLLEQLARQGIRTTLLLDASRDFPAELASGWDEVQRVTPVGAEETPLEAMLAAARSRLQALAGQDSWLLWVDLATLIAPWEVAGDFVDAYFQEPPEEEKEEEEEEEEAEEEDLEEEEELEEEEPLTPIQEHPPGPLDPDDDTLYLSLQTSYAAAVSYLDAGIGDLLDELARQDPAGEVLVLVTSDAGQALGEHGLVGPVRPWLHDEIVHIPLLLRLPGSAQAGRRVPALTQDVDLAPTLAALFGLAVPGTHGHDLGPLLRGEVEELRPYACSGLQVDAGIEWALRSPEWALLLPVQPHADDSGRTPQLYVRPDDRWEVNEVRQHHLEGAESLERTLRAFVQLAGQPGPLTPPPLEEEALSADCDP
jgi:arylsulfatase A-like enzyme